MRRSFLVIGGGVSSNIGKRRYIASAFCYVVLIVVSLTNRIELYNDWLDFHDVQNHRIQM